MKFCESVIRALLVISSWTLVQGSEDEIKAANFYVPNIVGGNPVPSGSNLYDFLAIGPSIGCLASLIHEDILLTSAHCAGLFDKRTLLLGANNVFGDADIESVDVELEVPHPQYVEGEATNNLMILKLDSPATTTPATWNSDPANPMDGVNVKAIGFGGASTLQEVNITVVESTTCAANYTSANLTIDDDAVICAGSVGAGPCDGINGDEGSPILPATGDSTLILGVATEFITCGATEPSVYARVSDNYEWIQVAVCAFSDNPPSNCEAGPASRPSAGDYAFYGVTGNKTNLCGAILIHPDTLLTAKSCLDKGLFTNGTEIYLGITDLTSKDIAEVVEVESTIAHEDFDTDAGTGYNINDLALVKITTQSTTTPAVLNEVYPNINDSAIKIGFASNAYDSAYHFLLEQATSGIDRNAMDCTLVSDELPFVCFGNDRDGDLCVSDLGGPLLDGNGDVIGINGNNTCGGDSFATSVSSHADWISDNLCFATDIPPTYCPNAPSAEPSAMPSASPSAVPTASPSASPSGMPSASPSAAPSPSPSASPSSIPSASPSAAPSASPSAAPSSMPSASPSAAPSAAPSASPSDVPSASPSASPSSMPSASPSATPSAAPSASPSAAPSPAPSVSPSSIPSASPSAAPSLEPSISPSSIPSASPSAMPSPAPSVSPSSFPSATPSVAPSSEPSNSPSSVPSVSPSAVPSFRPTVSVQPSAQPSSIPTVEPTPLLSCSERYDCQGILSQGTILKLDLFGGFFCFDICVSVPALFKPIGFKCGPCGE